jgi:hypothetical protein
MIAFDDDSAAPEGLPSLYATRGRENIDWDYIRQVGDELLEDPAARARYLELRANRERDAQVAYIRALGDMATHAHHERARWTSAVDCGMWVYTRFQRDHGRRMTDAEIGLYARVVTSLYDTQAPTSGEAQAA